MKTLINVFGFCFSLVGILGIGKFSFDPNEITTTMVWYATWRAAVGLAAFAVGIGVWEAWKWYRFPHLFNRR